MKKFALSLAIFATLLTGSALADSKKILWYTGGTESSGPGTYEAAINGLIGQAAAGGSTWTIDYWTSGPMPVGTYQALVVASAIGGWSSYPSYTALTSALPTLGDRVMVTGQDADWHYINHPGSAAFDGPQGFLLDAINWAGSGSGLGAVFLNTQIETTFLTGLGTQGGSDDTVVIPGAYSAFPINAGLTTGGISGWSTSSHESWTGYDTSLWTAINTNSSGGAVTLVSAATADGGTSVPDNGSTLGLLGLAMVGFVALRRKLAA
jgi:hypothetical protein